MSPGVFARERNQGRALDMGWVAHERWASTTASPISRPRSGSRSSSAPTAARRDAPAWPPCTAERLESLGAAPAGEGDPEGWCCRVATVVERRSWFVYAAAPPPRPIVTRWLRARWQGIQAKAYMPCIHLMPHYRERFGSRRDSSRSPRTPRRACSRFRSSGAMGEQQVDRVCAALARKRSACSA